MEWFGLIGELCGVQGLAPTAVQIVPRMGLSFFVYEQLEAQHNSASAPSPSPQSEPSTALVAQPTAKGEALEFVPPKRERPPGLSSGYKPTTGAWEEEWPGTVR